jgi:hypothetical protein
MNICREESLEAGRRKFPRVSSVLGEGSEEGVALMVGDEVGFGVGFIVGDADGLPVGLFVGTFVGELVGILVGGAVGATLGGDAEIPPPHAQHASFAVFPSVPV